MGTGQRPLLLKATRALAAKRLRTALTMLGVGGCVRRFIDKDLSVLGSNQLILRPRC